jgi:hypothetical protein
VLFLTDTKGMINANISSLLCLASKRCSPLASKIPNLFRLLQLQIKSNIIYFNCACATLICLNQTKQNGSHNTPLRELGHDQFSSLQVLRPLIRIKYTSLFRLVMLPQLCIDLLSSPINVYFHNLGSQYFVCFQNVLFEMREAS